MMRNDFNLNVNRETDDVIIKGYVDDDNQVIITEPDIGSGGGDGGGGAAGILKLTFTEDPENAGTYVCDHTWQEIHDALAAGYVVIVVNSDEFGVYTTLIASATQLELSGYSIYTPSVDGSLPEPYATAATADGYPAFED